MALCMTELNIIDLKKQLESAANDVEKTRIKSSITALKEAVERELRTLGNDIQYGVREWPIEVILQKFTEGLEEDENELFIPDYQREYKWDSQIASRFIESILLDFPIPYLYISNVDDPNDLELDGRIEIIDGSQRIRALSGFVNNEFPLSNLKSIQQLEGFTYDDLPAGRKRKFMRESLRMIELKGQVDEDARRDLFERINSGVKRLEAMEVRQGSQEATSKFFKDIIIPCSDDPLFGSLAPLSSKKRLNADHREFVLRFFAYLNDIDSYKNSVKPFLDAYLKKESAITDDSVLESLRAEFTNTMKFVQQHFGDLGFKKTATSKTTPRARYEAIAVGTAKALREDPALVPAIPVHDWIFGEEFQQIVGADGANNTNQLKNRIEFVYNKLLHGA
ncbi:DUF262 domain-containing protein [Vibrio crassostreae]|nr:DUF262 domain-containing protein [Vibrio crassostreae]